MNATIIIFIITIVIYFIVMISHHEKTKSLEVDSKESFTPEAAKIEDPLLTPLETCVNYCAQGNSNLTNKCSLACENLPDIQKCKNQCDATIFRSGTSEIQKRLQSERVQYCNIACDATY